LKAELANIDALGIDDYQIVSPKTVTPPPAAESPTNPTDAAASLAATFAKADARPHVRPAENPDTEDDI